MRRVTSPGSVTRVGALSADMDAIARMVRANGSIATYRRDSACANSRSSCTSESAAHATLCGE